MPSIVTGLVPTCCAGVKQEATLAFGSGFSRHQDLLQVSGGITPDTESTAEDMYPVAEGRGPQPVPWGRKWWQ